MSSRSANSRAACISNRPRHREFLCHLGHVDCGQHGPGHAPHQLSDRQSHICFCARMNQISQARCGRKAHGDKCRTHVAEEQRAMLGVIGWRIAFESGDRPLQKLWEHRAKVFSDAGSADAMQIVQRPDNAGRSPVETGVAVSHPIVTRVTRPERVGIEMGDRIGCNFFDRSPDSQFTPGVVCKRDDDDRGQSCLRASRARYNLFFPREARIARLNATYSKGATRGKYSSIGRRRLPGRPKGPRSQPVTGLRSARSLTISSDLHAFAMRGSFYRLDIFD